MRRDRQQSLSGTKAEPKKKNRSAFWLALHGWFALPVWTLMFFVCLTGSIATVSEEIVWLVEPAARANPPLADAKKLSYEALLNKVIEQRPDAVVQSIAIPVKGIHAPLVGVGLPGGRGITYYVNAYTGVIQGQKGAFDLRQYLRAMHGWLLLPWTPGVMSFGWHLVSALAIPMLGSLVTGLVVYKKFWRAYLRWPRLRIGKGARTFWGDFHRLAGLWSIPFIIIMSVTAGWFFIQGIMAEIGVTISTAGVPPTVAREDVRTGPDRASAQTISIDDAIAIARTRFADLSPALVIVPTGAYNHFFIFGRSAYPLVFETASINPYTGELAAARGIDDRTGLELITESMRPLHTGDFAGLWLKLVYLIFGLLLTMMVLSGLLIWTKRTAQATAKLLSKKVALAGGAVPEPAE